MVKALHQRDSPGVPGVVRIIGRPGGTPIRRKRAATILAEPAMFPTRPAIRPRCVGRGIEAPSAHHDWLLIAWQNA
jgi:hypothetical protein